MPSADLAAAEGDQLETLACMAAAAMVAAVTGAPAPTPDVSVSQGALGAPGASFVTLHRHGRLRGCIGSLQARRALHADVIANARSAALDDPRFPPVGTVEIDTIELDVSVLSTPEPLSFRDHADLVRRLRPGEDGLILAYRAHRATFLPSVWTQLPDPESFLQHLRHKAGIDDDVPTSVIAVQRYVTTHSPTVAVRPAAERARVRGLIA